MKRLVQIIFIFSLLLLSSCAKRYGGYPHKEIQRIENRLGLQLNPKDNIYLYRESSLWIGTPHRYGGCSIRGVDCSCFVVQVYKSVYNKKLSRSSQQMYSNDCRRIGQHGLREGDLLFFGNRKSKKIDHVGIYLKNGHFVHTSISKGVMVSRLDEPYFEKRFVAGGRVK